MLFEKQTSRIKTNMLQLILNQQNNRIIIKIIYKQYEKSNLLLQKKQVLETGRERALDYRLN